MARPEWVTYSDEEIEEMILKFNREGKSTSEIGIILRDQYGIPSVKDVTGERITEILKRNGFTVCAPHAPYPSRDKFNAVNTAFLNAKGEKHVFIARNRCPKLKEAFSGYCYKDSGEDTDKSTGLDHISDAAAYLICYNLPIKKSYGLNRPRVYGY